MDPSIAAWKDLADLLASIVTVLGVPVAIYVYWNQKIWERRQRELDAYSAADQRYVDYLVLCLEHPEAGAFEYRADDEEIVKLGLSIPQVTMFTILIATIESAYLYYRHQPATVQDSQWLGWIEYLQWWFGRPDFARAWPILSRQFHTDFIDLGDRLLDGEQPLDVLASMKRPARSITGSLWRRSVDRRRQ